MNGARLEIRSGVPCSAMRRGLKGRGGLQTSTDGSFSARHTVKWVGFKFAVGRLLVVSQQVSRTTNDKRRFLSPDHFLLSPASNKLNTCFPDFFTLAAASPYLHMAYWSRLVSS